MSHVSFTISLHSVSLTSSDECFVMYYLAQSLDCLMYICSIRALQHVVNLVEGAATIAQQAWLSSGQLYS